MTPCKLWTAVVLCCLAAIRQLASAQLGPRVIPFDPSIQVHVHEFGNTNGTPEARERFEIFPRHRVPQVLRIVEPGAVLLAVNIRELALLPGDRLEVRDATNKTILAVTASNQSVAKRWLERPPRVLWNHPLLTFGNRVTIEYWPSLRTLTLPINRPLLDNAVVVVDSYSFAFFPRSRTRASDDDDDDGHTNEGDGETLESTVGETNEMKPAVCYKSTQPEWYNKSRSVARLIIQQLPNTSTNTPSLSTAADTMTTAGSSVVVVT